MKMGYKPRDKTISYEAIADLQGKTSDLKVKNRKVIREIKAKTERIDKFNKCLVYADIIQDTNPSLESGKVIKSLSYNSY